MSFEKLLLAFTCIAIILSCERDEICIDPITPHLVLRFYDNENSDEFKTPNVTVEVIGYTGEPLKFTSDSIALPLDVNAVETTFVISSVTGTESNADTLKVSYTVADQFVGRACGYKTVFFNPEYTLTTDAEPWMISILSNSEHIKNEEIAHLKVFH